MRARATVRGEHAHVYKAPKQRTEERELIELVIPYAPREPLRGPIALFLACYVEPPKSRPKKWRADALAGTRRPTTKPDYSNYLKNFEDIANGLFWADDSQIVEILPGSGKYYGTPARWEIEIVPLDLLDD